MARIRAKPLSPYPAIPYADALAWQMQLAREWSALAGPPRDPRLTAIFAEAMYQSPETEAERRATISTRIDLVGRSLHHASPYYFASPICDAITAAAPSLPDDWTLLPEHVPTSFAFWWLAKPMAVDGSGETLAAVSWVPAFRDNTSGQYVTPSEEQGALAGAHARPWQPAARRTGGLAP